MWTSFIGPFVHPVGEEGIWIVAESINIQDPSYDKSILFMSCKFVKGEIYIRGYHDRGKIVVNLAC